jgi:hypothetical protein
VWHVLQGVVWLSSLKNLQRQYVNESLALVVASWRQAIDITRVGCDVVLSKLKGSIYWRMHSILTLSQKLAVTSSRTQITRDVTNFLKIVLFHKLFDHICAKAIREDAF